MTKSAYLTAVISIAFLGLGVIGAPGLAEAQTRNASPDASPDTSIESQTRLSPEQRVRVLESLRSALEQKYSLLEFKKEKLGRDPLSLIDDCIRIEQNRRSSVFENLRFYDRVRKCLGSFKDYHLDVREQTPRPTLYTGIGIKKANGRFWIASVHDPLVGRSADLNPGLNLAQVLEPGKEIVAIDGVAIKKWIAFLSEYTANGTTEGAAETALVALTQRSFLYPKARTQTIQLAAVKKPVVLRWWSLEFNQKAEAREYLNRLGIQSVHRIQVGYDSRIRNELDLRGYSDSRPLGNPSELGVFYNPLNGKIGMRMGIVKSSDREVCYIQLLTFEPKTWRMEKGGILPFLMPFESFLPGCEARGLPLIFDLRVNSGGDPKHTHDLLALLLKPGSEAPTSLFSGRMTRAFIDVVSKYGLGDGLPPSPDDLYSEGLRLKALHRALARNERYLPFVPEKNIVSSSRVKPFTGKILTLLSPRCASACEMMLDLLRVSKRSRFMGSSANGTSGGFLRLGEAPQAAWRDDLYGSLTVLIPNTIHVVGRRPVRANEYFFSFESHKALMRENRPFTAGVRYRPGVRNFATGGEAWLESAVSEVYGNTSRAPSVSPARTESESDKVRVHAL